MPSFEASVLDDRGAAHRRKLDAANINDALATLRRDGWFVEQIRPVRRNLLSLTRLRIPRKQQIHLFQQMQMLLSSGILIPDALEKLREKFPHAPTRQALQAIYAHVVESRGSLSAAFALFPRSFSPGLVSVIAAGEDAGTATLADRFGDLAERLAYEDANRKQVLQACAYPAFIMLLAALLCVFLLAAVFPRLTELLGSLGGRLPPLTRALIAASTLVRAWWWAILATLFIVPLALTALRRIPAVGLRLDQFFLRLPFVGTIYRQLTVALICTIYRSLYRSNKPAPEIIEACSKVVGNRAFLRALGLARERVMIDGTALSRALEETGLFPPIACMTIELGEQSGKLADALDHVARFCSAEAKESIAALVALLNPTMTILVVGGVGLVMVSFFQAIYQVVFVVH